MIRRTLILREPSKKLWKLFVSKKRSWKEQKSEREWQAKISQANTEAENAEVEMLKEWNIPGRRNKGVHNSGPRI